MFDCAICIETDDAAHDSYIKKISYLYQLAEIARTKKA